MPDSDHKLEQNLRGLTMIVEILTYNAGIRHKFLDNSAATLEELGVHIDDSILVDKVSAGIRDAIRQDQGIGPEAIAHAHVNSIDGPTPLSVPQSVPQSQAQPGGAGIWPMVMVLSNAEVVAGVTGTVVGATFSGKEQEIIWDDDKVRIDFGRIAGLHKDMQHEISMEHIQDETRILKKRVDSAFQPGRIGWILAPLSVFVVGVGLSVLLLQEQPAAFAGVMSASVAFCLSWFAAGLYMKKLEVLKG